MESRDSGLKCDEPSGRPIKEHMMDLEVQAAMAKNQNPVSAVVVRETIKGYVDIFVNDWLTTNPRQR